jgi:NAD(P)-dependent dehydrogenase (short-subunit alcohol dehydrogenase family)
MCARRFTQPAAAEPGAYGVPATAMDVDIADVAAIDDMISTVVATHGRINVMVNNAGVSPQADILDISPDDCSSSSPSTHAGCFSACSAPQDRWSNSVAGES